MVTKYGLSDDWFYFKIQLGDDLCLYMLGCSSLSLSLSLFGKMKWKINFESRFWSRTFFVIILNLWCHNGVSDFNHEVIGLGMLRVLCLGRSRSKSRRPYRKCSVIVKKTPLKPPNMLHNITFWPKYLWTCFSQNGQL